MRIGIDGNEANVSYRVGSNIYSYEVICNLFNIENSRSNNENKNIYLIYLRDQPLDNLPKETAWWKYRVVKPKRLWTQIALPITLYTQKEKLDVFFTPGHYAPRFCPFPTIICVFDTSYLSFPQYFQKDDLYQLKNWTAYSVKKAKKILTISESSKKDIIKYYGREANDIIVAYPGYNSGKFNSDIKNQSRQGGTKIKNINQKLKINGDYIIYVGTLQPRKNLIRLIEAFHELKTANQELKTLKLVIAGKRGWMFEEIFSKVKELSLEREVIFTGYVGDNDLPYLIAGAKLYILPSLYEGFGIPAAEAMAVGTPCIISKVSSLPEVGGKAAIYIEDPNNVESIAKALIYGLNLNENARDEIIAKGWVQVKKFNWKQTAEQISTVLLEFKKI